MEEKVAFSILEIELTKDASIVKDAYRNLLVKVNPEDDPQGFKRLRQAYETALAYAEKEEEEEKKAVTPVEKWMERVKDTYAFMSKRTNQDCWRELFFDEVCQDLDNNIAAREALLVFLMDHYRLKKDIWRMIDEIFMICEEKEELYEKFAKEFIDFATYRCTTEEEDFPYEWFQGEDNADYDTFLYHYYELSRNIDESQLELVVQTMETIDQLEISHPLFDLEKARYSQLTGEGQKAMEIIESLLSFYGKSLRVQVIGADIFWGNQEYEKAVSLFKEILEKYPSHYLANKRMGHYYLGKEEYETAKEYCREGIRQGSQEEDLISDMEEINSKLIEKYEEDCEKSSVLMERHLEIGWCYLYNKRLQEGIERLFSLVPDEETESEYHSLLGRMYYMDMQYHKAIEQLEEWIVCIGKENPETEEEIEKIPVRKAAAYELIGEAYHCLGKKEDSYYQIAVEKLDLAISFQSDEPKYYVEKASIYMETEDYKRALDMGDRIIEIDPSYFWGYTIRQEAYYNLQNGQGVIDNFYEAKNIYQYYPKMYELTVKAFINCNQMEEAFGILKQAEEAEVGSVKLDLMNSSVRRQLSNHKEDYQKAYEYCKAVQKKLLEKKADSNDLGEIAYELSRCCRGLDDQDEALKWIDEAIKHKADNQYLWIKGNIFLTQKKYKEALSLYFVCIEEFDDSDLVLGNIAYCYKQLENIEKALEYYKKVLEVNPENETVNSEILDIYMEKLKEKEDMKYFDLALPYANRQLELTPEAYYYIERGLLYMEAGVWEPALQDFQEAAKLQPDNTYAYNNMGCVYKYTKRYEEALEALKKAAKVMKPNETKLPYGNMGDCYERMGEYQKAVKCYMKNKKLFPGNKSSAESIQTIYRLMKRYDAAMAELKDAYTVDSDEYLLEKSDIHLEMEEISQAVKYIKQVINRNKELPRAYRSLGFIYLWKKKRPKNALKLYQKAFACSEVNTREYEKSCFGIMKCCYKLEKLGEVKKYGNLILTYYTEQYGSVENYLHSVKYLPARLYDLVLCYFYMGEKEKAHLYMEQMIKVPKCRHCTCQCCKEYYALKGILYEAEGESKKACECYRKVMEEDPNWTEYKTRLEELEKQL